jgi:TldD protein
MAISQPRSRRALVFTRRTVALGSRLSAVAASIAPVLDRELVEEVLREARRRGGSFAELFVESKTSTSIGLDDGKVEELNSGLDRGAGVRVARGTTYGYAYSNRTDRAALLEIASAAAAAAEEDSTGEVVALMQQRGRGTNSVERPAAGIPAADKVEWLRELDDAARAFSPEVVQVIGGYGDSLQRRLIATSDGTWIEEERPRILLAAKVVARRGDVIQTGFHGPAACAGVEFIDRHSPRATAEVAAGRAVTMLDSIPAPAGEMAVVLAPGMGGVLFHEAVGHPLEADAIDKEASVYRGLIGERCASELINGVDDATVPNGWGSFDFDDEGEAGTRTVLFEKGVLRSFLFDRLRAEKEGVSSTGNGRRESYAHPPIPRMTNTYILNGSSDPGDVLFSTPQGVYVTSLGGGQVNPATGDFVFGCSEAFLIERGEVTKPVRGANLIGRAIEVMSAVDAVADDFDTWQGVCGKDGQSAPVGSGSPTLRISRITVGGTGG